MMEARAAVLDGLGFFRSTVSSTQFDEQSIKNKSALLVSACLGALDKSLPLYFNLHTYKKSSRFAEQQQ